MPLPPRKLSEQQLARLAIQLVQQGQQQTLVDTLALPKQRAFIEDPCRLKAALCPRRSGKSYAIGLYLVREALTNPGCNLLFVAKTRKHAKDVIWKDILRPVLQRLSIMGTWNKSELTYTFPNGSVLFVTGADTSDDVSEKFRGIKYRLAIFDECASWRLDLQDIIYNKVGPAMADVLGTICMIGTPGNTKNFFHTVTTGSEPGWSVHQWSWKDNIHTATNVQRHIDDLLRANPLVAETPRFRQEYYGEWTIDESKLVYRYDAGKNSYPEDKLPEGRRWNYVIGLDLGFTDDTAWVIAAYADNDDRNLYIVDAIKHPKLIISDVARRTQQLIDHYDPISVVVDPKAKQSVEEMRQRFGLPLEDAQQRDKVNAIAMLNSDLITGVIKVLPAASDLVSEWEDLVWDERDLAKGRYVENTACSNHLSDACLYAWRKCRNYATAASAPKPPPPNSDEWAQQFWERDTLRLQRRQNQPWWERDIEPEDGDAW